MQQKKNGFKNYKNKAKTGIYDYADIDDDLISIHHFLKIYKFGFSRVQDNLSLEIRNGRISRSKAVEIVKKNAFKIPYSDINKFCNFVGFKKHQFFEICEKFRNKNIWKKKTGKWKLITEIK